MAHPREEQAGRGGETQDDGILTTSRGLGERQLLGCALSLALTPRYLLLPLLLPPRLRLAQLLRNSPTLVRWQQQNSLHSLIPFALLATTKSYDNQLHAKPNQVTERTRTIQEDHQLGLGCLESEPSNIDFGSGTIADHYGYSRTSFDGRRGASS